MESKNQGRGGVIKKPFSVYSYRPKTLIDVIARESGCDRKVVSEKTHLFYFRGYFDYIKASTIVVERNYIDRDYLEDYSAYYVRCFKKYERECTRLHFFKNKFSENDLRDLLKGQGGELTSAVLNRFYLGFVVIKPLPKTIVGRTCLKTYTDKPRRKYPITRQYDANLFGIKLTVDKTLAFQEQDSVVAACATSALWSAFQGTGMLFHHKIPSPVEITKNASEYLFAEENRIFPNTRVKPEMMANAIRNVGLEPYPINVLNDSHLLTSSLYAYLRCRIPVVMGMYLFDTSIGKNEKGYQHDDSHAVAVTGYSLGKRHPIPDSETGLLLRSSRIDKIYVHDDQVGPFARMEIDGIKIDLPDNKNKDEEDGEEDGRKFFSLSTSWADSEGTHDYVRSVPKLVMIPLYHKIRIPYDAIEEAIMTFDAILEMLRTRGLSPFLKRFEWDIFLSTVNDFKSELFKQKNESLNKMLTKELPHFLWRATAREGNKQVMDLLFDATDIEQG
ncbi:MAG: hypothetical protein ACC707_20080, partial [Thiohalomonadales bacterium]